MNYDFSYRTYVGYVEPALKQVLAGIHPPLKEAMAYSLLAEGKRLRPVLVLACCDAVGGEINNALPFACAIEMIHAYSLIHDDLPCMDDDDLRRGRPTNHKVFGEGMAVLAGDGLLSLAFELMAQQAANAAAPAGASAALLAVARGAGVHGMVGGQSRDLTNTGQAIDLNELRRIHAQKTGALITAACLAGAYLGGADETKRKAIEAYGQQLGMAFQIADDILDATADAQSLGKTPGKDARDHKTTYVSLCGLEQARALARSAAQTAMNALEPLGEAAWFLCKTAQRAASRSK